MTTRRYFAAFMALGLVPTIASAQFDNFDEKLPWEYFKLNPKTRVKLDFRNASVDAVLGYLSKASGIAIIKDPTLVGPITLQSPKEQSLNDAFSMLSARLSLQSFDLSKQGNFLIIRARNARGGNNGAGRQGGGFTGFNPGMMGQGGFPTSAQLKTYSLKYANATQVARVINDVFANSGQNVLMQQMLNGQFPVPGTGQPAAPGTPPAGTLPPTGTSNSQGNGTLGTQIAMAGQGGFGGFGGQGGRGNRGGGGGFGGFGQGGFGGFGQGGFGRGGGAGASIVRASADDYSNTVIVNAPSREQEQVAKIIDEIDKETDQPQQSKVFKLSYAAAQDMVGVIQNLLLSNVPRGRGGQTTTGGQGGFGGFGQGGFGGFGGFNRNGANAQVVAEPRTNSLLVTTTKDNLDLVAKVISELDKEIKVENSTFVINLENARADLIAQLLNQSFGSRNGGGNTNRTTGGLTGAQGRTNRTTGGGGGGGNSPASLGRGVPQPEEPNPVAGTAADGMMLNLANPGAGQGELATMVTVQQGGGFGGFGGFGGLGQGGFGQNNNRQRNTTSGVTGLDAQGRVVNLRDLTGQVNVIPDINTNSVIVVTSPENRALLEQIVNQLDRIPEQVMIETLIVEASLDATSKLGIEWNFGQGTVLGQKGTSATGSQSFGNQASTAQPQGFRYTLTGGQYSAFLTALDGDSRFEVLSTPRIFTSNNSTAEINISQSLPYVLSQRTDANGNLTFNYSFLDVGIILTVTPRITSNGYVTMDVTQTANDFVRYTDFNAPVVNQREAQTTVSVKDGETIVLGGIIKNSISTTVNKLPIIGDIPVLGKLFQSSGTAKSKTELLVFLTPHVVRDVNDARKLRGDTTKQLNPKVQDMLKGSLPKDATKPDEAPTKPVEKTTPEKGKGESGKGAEN